MSTISASTTSTTAFKIATDTTGALVFQTGASPTTAMTLGSDQSVTFAGTPTYSSGTANGVAYLNGSKVLTTGSALVFDGTNLGVGVTPSAWSTYKSIQLPDIGFYGSQGPYVQMIANAYYNGTNYTRITANQATMYAQAVGQHQWHTAGSSTAGSTFSFTQAMTLDASGNFIVGATATDSGAKTRIVFGASQNGVQIKDSNDTSNAAYLIFQNGSNSNFATISRDGTNNSLSIGTVSAITFPATQVASAGANTLDDYEEGSWSPALTGSGGGSYTMTGVTIGKYVKIGKLVWVTCSIQWSGVPTAYSGNLVVSGLPFTVSASGGRTAGCLGAVSSGISFTSGYGEWQLVCDPGYSFFYIIQNASSGSGYSHTPTVGSTGIVYALTICYEAS